MTAADVLVITDSVDYSTIITGLGAIAAAVAVVYIAVRGAKMLLGMIRS